MSKKQNYRQHINKLLVKYNIRVIRWIHWSHPSTRVAWAYIGTRLVVIPYPKTLRSFYVALHEIGHIVSRNIHSDEYYLEYLAETWALKHMELSGYEIPASFYSKAKAYVLRYLIYDWTDGTVTKHTIKKEVLQWLGITLSDLDMCSMYPAGFYDKMKKNGVL